MTHKYIFIIVLFLGLSAFVYGNGALSFDGINDCVAVGSTGVSNVYSVEMWFKPSVLGGTGDIIQYGRTLVGSSATNEKPLWLSIMGSELRIRAFSSSNDNYYTTTGANLQVGNWYHVAVTAQRGAANRTKLYLNGVLMIDQPSFDQANFNNIFTLGDLRPGRLLCYGGLMDEVRLWNDIRTQSEILAGMTGAISPTEQGLVGYWKLDETSGPTAYDQNTPANDGTVRDGLVTDNTPSWTLSDLTLPVELSSFMAVGTSDFLVRLTWTSETEIDVSGYYVYRNTTDDFSDALRISPLIEAQNSTTTQLYSFVDEEVTEGTWYYWLQNLNFDGSDNVHGPVSYSVVYGGDPGIPEIPTQTSFTGIYPNPFNPAAYMQYFLTETSDVTFDIYNSRGQLVRTIGANAVQSGLHSILWDGKDSSNTECSTGLYFFRMTSGTSTFTRKALLVK